MCAKRQRERKPRGKKKVRKITPIAGSTDILVSCVYNCGTTYRTARRTVDNKRWHKSLRCVNAHESQRCHLRHSKTSCESPSHRPRKRARARSARRLRRTCTRVVAPDAAFTPTDGDLSTSPRPAHGRQRRSAALSARRKWQDGIRAAEQQELEDSDRSDSDSERSLADEEDQAESEPEPEPEPQTHQVKTEPQVKMEPRWLSGAAGLRTDGFQELSMEERPMKREPKIALVRMSSAQSQQSFDGGDIDIMLLDTRIAAAEASVDALRGAGGRGGLFLDDVTDSLGELKFLMPSEIPLRGQQSAVARAAATAAAGGCAQVAAAQATTASGAAQTAATEAKSWSAAAVDAAAAPRNLHRQNASLDLERHLATPSAWGRQPTKLDIEAANGMMPLPSMGDHIGAAMGRMCPPGA